MGFVFLLSAIILAVIARLFFPHKLNFALVFISVCIITGYYFLPIEYQKKIDNEINKISYIKGS